MQVAIDTGGTFTDCLGQLADGRLVHAKVPSQPADPTAAILHGLALLQELGAGEPITRLVHGTTVATNALLEGTGDQALLVVPRGFEDLLELGRQHRAELYSLHPALRVPAMPRSQIVGIPARLLADGTWAQHWTDADLAQLIADIEAWGVCEAIGICLLHGHRYPAAERELAVALRAAGLPATVAITLSCDLSVEAGEFERATTTAINARLLGPVGGYLERLEAAITAHYPAARLEIVLSNGDTLPVRQAARMPVRLLLSGPAGGVQLGWQIAQAIQRPVITLDIGGTSTDVACIPEKPLVRSEGQLGGFPIRTPMLDIETIGAGGGSLLWCDAGGALQVGPHSAGADPGPACYGRGGTLPTLTDAHLLAGHLSESIALAGDLQLDKSASLRAFAPLIAIAGLSAPQLAEGAIAIANQRIARAIRAISSARGIDPARCALVPMGGAGGLHAVGVAQLLGIDTIVLPPYPGLASAQGLAACGFAVRHALALTVLDPDQDLSQARESLRRACESDWRAATSDTDETAAAYWSAEMRFAGQDRTLLVPLEPRESLVQRFHTIYQDRFGQSPADAPAELVRLGLVLLAPRTPWPLTRATPSSAAVVHGSEAWVSDGTPLSDDNSTTLIPRGTQLSRRSDGLLMLAHFGQAQAASHQALDAVGLTIANDLFSAIAEEMAAVLEHLGHSSNIKDRRDLSTALFDGAGHLLAQGAHIPVHLGSMEASVTAARQAFALQPGDAVILNSPFAGGTHLPDITLVTCVELGPHGHAYVASRAHHADIGGAAPGSMPLTDQIADEGLLIPPTLIATAGVIDHGIVDWIAQNSRQPAERRGDLQAQLTANARGAVAMQRLAATQGPGWYSDAAVALPQYAAAMVQSAWTGWQLGEHQATVVLESDGLGAEEIEITLTATLRADDHGRRSLVLDFDGTSGPVPGPVNCPRAVVLAAIAFVVRCLAADGTPANAGLLADVDVRIPQPSLLDAAYPATTAAGNVETSQKIVAVLCKALQPFVPNGLPRPSQGTMNNLLLGGLTLEGHAYTYYETIAGGCGAGPLGEGASATQSHMTNSRNTPIEILETRFPFVIEQYSLRPDSGGWPATERGYFGGLGVQRAYRFLTDATLTLIADWPRHTDPNGPKAGAAYLLHPDDTLEALPSKITREVTAGMVLLVATPGGWAWDPPSGTDQAM